VRRPLELLELARRLAAGFAVFLSHGELGGNLGYETLVLGQAKQKIDRVGLTPARQGLTSKPRIGAQQDAHLRAVPTAAHCQQEVAFAAKVHRADHVGHSRTADDERRMAVYHSVVDLAGAIVAPVLGTQQLAAKLRSELVDCRAADRVLAAAGRRDPLISHHDFLLSGRLFGQGGCANQRCGANAKISVGR
jgi:hypothetical protein